VVADVASVLEGAHLVDAQTAELIRNHALQHQLTQAKVAVKLGGLTENQVFVAVVRSSGLNVTEDLAAERADPEAVALLTREQAESWSVVPLRFEGSSLIVAGTPHAQKNSQVNVDLGLKLGATPYRWLIARAEDIRAKIAALYRNEAEMQRLAMAVGDGGNGLDTGVRLVNLHLEQAITDRASDIHFEPTAAHLNVRYRIDGVLTEREVIPRSLAESVISRLKIMADIDPSEKRKPQDGRIRFPAGGRTVDMRVATAPVASGLEEVIIRILDNSASNMDIARLGLSEHTYGRWSAGFIKPNGMLLATGPTGSGKSTTLYATLTKIVNPKVKVITVEDPVEYRISGISQRQVNPKAGVTFASSLRSILRSDPDVILVGEIRDKETATIAIEAALTGHLVLSSLHTNSAPEAVVRLVEMGVEPFLVSSVVECALGQRLVRRLCEACKAPDELDPDLAANIGFVLPEGVEPAFFRPVGCARCSEGYMGRVALHEAMSRSPAVEKAIVKGSISGLELHEVAIAEGMRPMRADGWLKVAQGVTTISEVLRVVA